MQAETATSATATLTGRNIIREIVASGVDFVVFEKIHSGVIRKPSILLQRTTNSRQARRLVAAVITRKVVQKYKGYVGENHTIALIPCRRANLSLLSRLLNSDAVDKRFRRVGGTSSISIAALLSLPLLTPKHLRSALKKTDDFEAAVELARAWHRQWTPMGRLGTPADVGNAVSLLCADEAAWITGQTIHVDGGASLMDTVLPLEMQMPQQVAV